ncbi:hypothetical protein [Butyrivibrio sp. AE2032]|uniref:hypothetical protein n=1 Tax=Butyrivibrio sp. AE2032 TaxID=1458463 RepID=UPI000552FEC7|nr:hypothetical protein [Butyrivibrio sp. AE2032]
MRYVETSHIKIADVEARLDGANQLIDDYIFDCGLKEKEALRLRLLSEEVLRLAKSIIGHGIMDFWLEGNSRVTRIHLLSDNHMDKEKQQELISVSSTGTNSSEEGFFGILKSMFSMQGLEENTWSLKEYQAKIMEKRASDKYSQEAWDDLERSLVANLADNIEVSVNKNEVSMVVTKDFSEALSTVGSRVPEITTQFTFVDSDKIKDDKIYAKADELIADLGLTPKDAVHMKLLFEETVGMLKALTADYHAAIWFEKYKHECCIRVTGKTEMSQDKKEGLLDMASQKGNTLVKGFMDKVADVIENGLLNYNNVMKLQQEYGGGTVNYGTMGMYNGIEGMADAGIMWSLYEYKDALKDAKDDQEHAQAAWDELEKSIVASLAKDVLVGVKGNRLDITIVCDIK